MILLIGSEGSMGKRYQAIFNYIQSEYAAFDGYYFEGYECWDIKNKREPLMEAAKRASKFIITTPTETHCELISELSVFEKPILCEKPITTDIEQLKVLLDFLRRKNVQLTMVNQYAYYVPDYGGNNVYPLQVNPSCYNFFRHGNDGLAWDCINILGLAKGPVSLGETSPFWKCTINGFDLKLGDVDHMYMRMILDWMRKGSENIEYIEHAHKKVVEYETKTSFDRNPG